MRRLWVCILTICTLIFAGITLVSCGNTPPEGYLSQTPTSLIFLQFTATGQSQQQLSGNITTVEENTNDTPPRLQTSTTAFTGVENGSALTLTISFFGISSSFTGTLNGNTLTLDFPQTDGSIQAKEFVASSLQQYNQAVALLQKQVADQVVQYADSQATTTAAQSTATAQQQNQQAVQDASQQLSSAMSAIQQDSNTLAQFSERSTLQGYANDWKQMQNDYTTEYQQAQQGCGPGGTNHAQVSDDAAQVNDDAAQINNDNAQFNDDHIQYNQDVSSVQTDIQDVQSDWTQLQQALTANPGGIPGTTYTANDVQAAVAQGEKAINAAKNMWKNAQTSVSQYDQDASALQQKAEALPNNMNC